jgi:hypothetical protein
MPRLGGPTCRSHHAKGLSFPKTPSVLSCKDLRLLIESATYIKRTDSKDQERTEDGSSSADMSTLLSQPCSY